MRIARNSHVFGQHRDFHGLRRNPWTAHPHNRMPSTHYYKNISEMLRTLKQPITHFTDICRPSKHMIASFGSMVQGGKNEGRRASSFTLRGGPLTFGRASCIAWWNPDCKRCLIFQEAHCQCHFQNHCVTTCLILHTIPANCRISRVFLGNPPKR